MATLTTGIGGLSLTVTGCTGNGVSPIVLTVASVPDSVEVGQLITVASVGGNTNANGDKTITAKTATTITFAGTGNGAYTSGGTISRKYATIHAWEAATGGAIGSNVVVGEVYADAAFDYSTPSANLTFTGATGTSASSYRHLKAWTTHRYDLFTGEGVRLDVAIDNTFQTGLTVNEPYFRITGIGVELTGVSASSGTFRGIDARSCAGAILDGVTVRVSQFVNAVGLNVVTTGQDVSSYNCIVTVDAGQALTSCRGFLLSNLLLAGTYRAVNCLAVGCVGSTLGHGFTCGSGAAVIANCVATGSSDADFYELIAPAVFASCISSDDTALTATGGVGNVASTSLYRYEAFRDYRPVVGSAAIDAGLDYSSLFTLDITGAARVAPWEIGPWQGYVSPDTAAPTIVEETIGASGRDYATIGDWVTATALHLVSRGEIRRGVLYDDADFAETVTWEGATTDARRYRELVPATGKRYDPVRDSGVAIVDAALSPGAVVQINEDYARLNGVLVRNTDATGGATQACVSSTGAGVVLDSVTAIATAIPGSSQALGLSTSGASSRIRNCIAIGNSQTLGLSIGIAATGAGSKVQNCAALRIRRTATGTGFKDGGVAGAVTFENCVSGSTDTGFGFSVAAGLHRNNASADTTAPGLDKITGITAANVWTDSTNNDLRLIAGCQLVNAGANLGTEFTEDIAGTARTGVWEIGPYTNFLAPPRWPKVDTREVHRLVPVWAIERRDGFALRIAGHPTALVHDGETYEPEGGIDATAYRREASLRDHSLEAAGIINSDRITFADLDAGLYNGAKITMRLVDWRFPWAAPRQTSVFILRRVSFDGEGWRAETEGVAALLKRQTGRVYGPACPYKFGSANPDAAGRAGCGLDVSLWTTFDVEVATVTDARLVFEAKSVAPNELSGSFTDDYFAQGWLVWTTGDNAGQTQDIRAYTQSTRGIELFLEAPFPVQVGDRFNIVAGDDKTFTTCKTKFSNGANFGGDPWTPGTQKAMQTPTS